MVYFADNGLRVVGGGKVGMLALYGNIPPGNILQVACRYLPQTDSNPAFSTEGLAEELVVTDLPLPK